MTYFFACSYPLETGNIVNPGNWGRMIKNYPPQAGHPWLMIRELIYEDVRKRGFSDKPSRFESIFLCETEEGIKNFIAENNRQFDIAYEVSLLNLDAPIHKGCLINESIANTDKYVDFERKAYEY